MSGRLTDLHIVGTSTCDNHHHQLLHALNGRGVYQRLHLHMFRCQNQADIYNLQTLPNLVEVGFNNIAHDVDLPPLAHITSLRFFVVNSNIVNKTTTLAHSLTKLTQLIELEFNTANLEDISPFIANLPKLQNVIVKGLGTRYIDPIAMNRQRQQIITRNRVRPTKVKVYLPKYSYLDTRWKTSDLDLQLIEIKRIESWLPPHSAVAS